MKGRRVVLGTGGTIAGRAQRLGDNMGYVAGQVTAQELIGSVPGLKDVPLEVEQIAQIDSKNMGFALWQRLAQRVAHHLACEDVTGVVITHGTDTLEETGYFLQRVLRPKKPVVLTCAMRPATALSADGPQNLLDAVAVAGDAHAHGTVVVCAGFIHAAKYVTKVHTYRVDAFDSGDAGPLGCVEEGKIRWFHRQASRADGPAVAAVDMDRLQRVLAAAAMPRVEWITSHADADGGLLRTVLELCADQPHRLPEGLVVAGTGNGTLHESLEAVLMEMQTRGVRVLRTSRCIRGQVVPGVDAAIPDSSPLSPAKARIALALELMGL